MSPPRRAGDSAPRTRPTSRLRPLVAAFAFAALVGVGGLATPRSAVACMCVAPLPGIAAYSGPEDAVLVGRVGIDDGTGVFAFHVERWFHGGEAALIGLASASRRQPDGTWLWNECGVELRSGDRLILVARRGQALYTPVACLPIASADSPEGLEMIAAAERAFGPGRAPVGSPPAEPSDPGPVLLAVGIAAVLLVGAGIAFARRERSA